MKIKEVIEKTGLTDRAIRLYIDEGLAAPSIEESYSGRKSIEFSDGDVERLNNVAMLRKAGFSIADIKSIVDDKATAKEVVGKFIEQTEIKIEHETEIVEKLKGISFDEDVTLETICDSLSAAVEEKQVPSEDLKLTLKEKIKKTVSVVLACVQLAFALSAVVVICLIIFDFRFIKFDFIRSFSSLFYAGWLVVIAFSAIVIWQNTGKRFQRRIIGLTAGLLTFAVIGNALMVPTTFLLLFCNAHPFYSQTTDPDNYLKLDRGLESYDDNYNMDLFFEVFPRKMPQSAKTTFYDKTHYFYEYTACSDGYYGTYDICAEWVMPKEDFEEKLENQENKGRIFTRGDWTFIYYDKEILFRGRLKADETGKSDAELRYENSENEFDIIEWKTENYMVSYSFLICAYNEKRQTVRYIASGACGHESKEDGPYYLSLDW